MMPWENDSAFRAEVAELEKGLDPDLLAMFKATALTLPKVGLSAMAVLVNIKQVQATRDMAKEVRNARYFKGAL